MPAEWLLPAAMAVRVELEISVVEEDRDLVLGLLQECLLSREEECWVSSHLYEGLPLDLTSFPYMTIFRLLKGGNLVPKFTRLKLFS